MLATRFTDLVGCSVPIQQAPLGRGIATPELAAAVSNAGGLGTVCVYGVGYTPDVIERLITTARKQTQGPIAANFLMQRVERSVARERIAAAASCAQVVDFFWGEPDAALVQVVHDGGALACWQVGSREEALSAADAGCDFIIAQGIEAGGHVRGHLGLLALLGEILPVVDVPVLAAGGIGTGRALAAVLAAGAAGARIGTRFVATEESGAHPAYVQALIAAEAGDTIYTNAFSVGWPESPHRVLRACLAAAEAFQGDVVGEYVDPNTGRHTPAQRFLPFDINKAVTGTLEAMPHWAGESVGGVKSVQPAAEIVRELVDEAEKCLQRWR